jgi:Cu/Ag efflux protein CusF
LNAKYLVAAALAAALAACGGPQQPAGDSVAATELRPGAETYSGTGIVTAVTGNQVTIDHGAIEGTGWPAMTMTFGVEDAQLLSAIRPGDRVTFSFGQSDGRSTVTLIANS